MIEEKEKSPNVEDITSMLRNLSALQVDLSNTEEEMFALVIKCNPEHKKEEATKLIREYYASELTRVITFLKTFV